MPQSLVQTMQAIIEPPYALPKVGAMFEIVETAKTAKNKKVLIGGAQGFGFTLDQPTGGHSWKFIAKSPLSGVVSVCDGIWVFNYDSKNYIVVMDLKSNGNGSAFKQIKSGILLCDWLCSLLTLNNHTHDTFEYIGLICKSRGAVAKKTTRKGLKADKTVIDGVPYLTVANPGRLYVSDLVELI
ncbi:hypothetical protein L9W84_16965 [Vibrio aestuarianus]|uniref:hypothetical protein n=1 Tax=Vibrio aestuarianus TaxID=28171 RepID=UPI00237D223D|nr:hypothetical protein [Vibrio aestuarianus]MDE1215285.1 hypothetical protein [Vibrio aestuarianus]